jgi:hypothetical protein
MAELVQSWSNGERAGHYREQAQKFGDMARHEAIAEIKAKMLELAEQYDSLARQYEQIGAIVESRSGQTATGIPETKHSRPNINGLNPG